MAANAIITNSKSRTLKKRLDELIQHSKEIVQFAKAKSHSLLGNT